MNSRLSRYCWLLVLLAGIAAYANSFSGVFLFDDVSSIVESPSIRHFSTSVLHSTRPVVGFSFWLNYTLGGLKPADFHLVNLVIHLIAGLILYGIVRRTMPLLSLTEGISEEDTRFVSAIAAAVWVAHPLHTESVTYISQRAESLMGMFYLMTVYFLAVGSGKPDGRRWYAASVISCAIGMATKPVMMTAPLMALAYDRFFLSKSFMAALRARWRLYVLLAVTCAIPVVLVSLPNESSSSSGVHAGASSLTYFLTQQAVILNYIKLSFWPVGLCLDYDWPPIGDVREAIIPGAVIAVLLVLTIWASVRRHPLGFCGLWFFVTLAPSSSFIPVSDLAFEHRMYLPLAALAVGVVVGLADVMRQFTRQHETLTMGGRPTYAVFATCLVVALAATTWFRNLDYLSAERAWLDTAFKRPGNARAYINLSACCLSSGDMNGTINYCDEALKHLPDFRQLEISKLKRMKDDQNVERLYRDVAYYSRTHNNIGLALRAQGRLDDAIAHFKEATRLIPENASSQVNLASAMFARGQTVEAIALLKHAIELDPRDHAAYECLGNALVLTGNAAAAAEYYAEAIALRPDDIAAQCKLAWLLATNPDASVRDGRYAVLVAENATRATNRGSAHILDVLAAAYAENGRFDDAVANAKKAIELAAPDERAAIQARLELYVAGKAYHEPDRPANRPETNQ